VVLSGVGTAQMTKEGQAPLTLTLTLTAVVNFTFLFSTCFVCFLPKFTP